MIALTEAISRAKEYVRTAYAGEPLEDLRLEEVQRTDDQRYWLITVGMRSYADLSPAEPGIGDISNGKRYGKTDPGIGAIPTLPEPMYTRYPRDYKVVQVDGNTGEVVAMTNRAA